MTNTAPILEVHDLVKDFGGVRAVDHCSLRIKRGAITGIIGPNGAGKTTLFNLVSGAMSPTSGQVIFDGRRIDKMGMHQTFGLGLVRTFQIPRSLSEKQCSKRYASLVECKDTNYSTTKSSLL